jgi:hypothetical protein
MQKLSDEEQPTEAPVEPEKTQEPTEVPNILDKVTERGGIINNPLTR